ncbi:predicted protein, partial [Nematostella vectensis]
MYGLLLESIRHFIVGKYGEELWSEIVNIAGTSSHEFVTHRLYDENWIFKIANAATTVLGDLDEHITVDDCMRLFGVCFVKFFSFYGYDPIIRVSGRHFRDFLIGIDSLHEHMRFGYPKMKSPTFYCDEETSTGINLHYESRRKGFMFYVVGQVEEIARKFYGISNINVKILKNESSQSSREQCHIVYRLEFNNEGYKPPPPDFLTVGTKKAVSTEVFFSIFPFSLVISPDMTLSMFGNGLQSLLGKLVLGRDIREVFILRRPKTDFTWHTLLTRKVVFELLSKVPLIRRPQPKHQGSTMTLHLRGQMKFMHDWDKFLFICSPLIANLDTMLQSGLYMNDLSMHDTSQEMALSGIKPLPQLEYARDQQFEQGIELEENMRKLEEERQRSEDLLYRMVPKPIAERLKRGGNPIDTCEEFDAATVLFSYMDGFTSICTRLNAMQAVTLINNLFIKFDLLTEKHNVYKFETLGDALYMAVSGVPVRTEHHAEPMAAMALDMLKAVQLVKDPITKKPMTITVGIHSGPVAAGLVGERTLQYCLFGDTVNIASRLRTTALPMRIHISENCRECLEESDFITEFRGEIELK